jgi:hypothetical protein
MEAAPKIRICHTARATDRTDSQGARRLKHPVGDAAGEILLEEGERLAHHVPVVLPMDHAGEGHGERMVDDQPEQDGAERPHQDDDGRHGQEQRPRLVKNALRGGVRQGVDQAADEIGHQRLHHRQNEADREERPEHAPRLGDEVPVEARERVRRRSVGRLPGEVDPGLEEAEHRQVSRSSARITGPKAAMMQRSLSAR